MSGHADHNSNIVQCVLMLVIIIGLSRKEIHLSHVINTVNDDVSNILHCYNSFCKQVNYFGAHFKYFSLTKKKCRLFQNFCL